MQQRGLTLLRIIKMTPIFDCDKFKQEFSIFKDDPCEDIELCWKMATFYLPMTMCVEDKERYLFIYSLMTAHILYLAKLGAGDDPTSFNLGNVVTSSRAGDTAVTYNNINYKDRDSDWLTFLKRSPFGLSLAAYFSRPRTSIPRAVSRPICGRAI